MDYLQPALQIDGKFQNPIPTEVGGFSNVIRLLPQLLFGKEERVPRRQLGPFVTDPAIYNTLPTSGLRVTWFGHSGLLLEIDGIRLLIDPVWSLRASPLQWSGPKRFWPPTLSLDQLPPLDAILLSHDHYDHLDEHFVRSLAPRIPIWITSIGVGKDLRSWGVPSFSIRELNWTERTVVTSPTGNELEIIALPSRHFSGRSLFNRFETLWSSFVLRSPAHNLFYGADSGKWPGFRQIGEQFGTFDLTLLEIGASNPAWENIHLGPDNAVQAHLDLGGRLFMPIHWGLFSLALHAWQQPIERVQQLATENEIGLFLPTPGQPTDVAGSAFNTNWWKG